MIYKIMKNRNNILGELACIAACIAVSVFFLNSLCPYWDDGASVRPVYDYFALGIDSHSWYGEGWFFNLYKLIPTVAYFVGGGYSTYSVLLIHAIWSGMCLYLAMHLAISQSRDGVRSWSTILFLVFIYLPTNTEAVWIRYHKPAIFFILAFLLLIYLQKNESNNFPFNKKVILLGIVLLIYGWTCCTDYLLLIEGIILPIGLYLLLWSVQNEKRRKRLIICGVVAGLFYAIFRGVTYAFIPMDFNYNGWGDWIAWNSVGDINQGIILYFSDWMEYWNIYPVGASLLSINSVMYIIRIMVMIAAIYCECIMIFRILKNGVLSEHPIDVLACLIIMINFFASIISVTGFRYAQASYYLYGVILCREVNRRVPEGIFYGFKNIKVSWNFMKYIIFSILIFDFIDISSVLYRYEDYQMSTVDNGIEKFAEENQLEYGIGSYNIVTEPEMHSEGKVSIQPGIFPSGRGFQKHTPYYYADFMQGSNLHNFVIIDHLRWVGAMDESGVKGCYGKYIKREEFSDINDKLCMVLYQFDYDVRWKTEIIDGQEFTGEDVYQWRDNEIALQPYKEGLSYCVELPLGRSRITMVGDGLVENMMEILDNDDIISAKCVLQNADEAEYEIVCKRATDVTLQMSNSTSNWVVVRRLEIQRLYAANYILEDAVDLTREKEVERDFRIPEGEYYVVIRGENLKNASVIFEVNGEKCEYEKVANGDKQLIYKISEEKEKKISIRVQNNGKQTCTIERITYEDAQVQFE